MSYTIVATDQFQGIGLRGQIPWSDTLNGRQDMAHFKKLTVGNAVIMGWNTYVSIGRLLPGRLNIIVTANHLAEAPPASEGVCVAFSDPDAAIKYGRQWEVQTGKKCFVIGGEQLFRYYFSRYNPIEEHVTVFPGNYNCDTFYPRPNRVDFEITNNPAYCMYTHTCLEEEEQYLSLFRRVMSYGHHKNDRTGTGAISLFSPPEMRFSLRNNDLPVLTTKTVALKTGVIPELLWFMRGYTDTKLLEAKGCNIWKGNTSRAFLDSRGLSYAEKDMGPGYGFQWRHSGAIYHGMNADYTNQGVDQLQQLIDMIRNDPDSRRMVICSWAPPYISQMALPPCHILYQVYTHTDVNGRRHLSAKMYQRSADSFLGVPFNITSYAILTHILAELTGCVPHELVLTFGDYHVYRNHLDQVQQQLSRRPRAFPKIFFKRQLLGTSLDEVTEHDFEIVGYSPYGHITAPMAV